MNDQVRESASMAYTDDMQNTLEMRLCPQRFRSYLNITMSYEILILDEDWFYTEQGPDHFRVLTEIINKGFSKVRDRYKVVSSPRIHSHEYLLSELHLQKNHNVTAAILLGTEEAWESVEHKTGFRRTFNSDISTDNGSYDSDVPPHILEEFGQLSMDNAKFTKFQKGQFLEDLVKNRVLGTAVIQSLDEYKIAFSGEEQGVPQYELAGFTAFSRLLGAKFLDFAIELVLGDRSSPYVITREPKVFLCCTVIKEHNLVEYYTKKCQFEQSNRSDFLITLADSSTCLGDHIRLNKELHVSFLHRTILPHD